MPTTVDSLQIEVQANSTEAGKGIELLAKSLGKLKSALGKGNGFGDLVTLANAAKTASERMDGVPDRLRDMADALNALGKIKSVKLSSTVAPQLTALGNASKNIGANVGQKLTNLASGLTALQGVQDLKISSTIATGISSINEALNQLNVNNLPKIDRVATALTSLNAIQGLHIPSGIADNLINIGVACEQLQGVDFTPLTQLATAMTPLTQLGQVHLGSIFNQLERLPQVFTALQGVDMDAFSDSIQRLTTALSPLATQLGTIGSGFANLPNQINQATNATNRLATANRTAVGSYTDLYSVVRMVITAVRGVASRIASWINQSNEYIENINLFNASMGQYAQQAQEYAEKVGDAVGIDPGQWMRNQGVFMTLATGFGVVGDRAYVMSQQLTQLGYDLASFFNLPFEESMQKLQSGISGELEPLRRLGFDLSQARLKAIALDLGIKKTFNDMTQAEKAQLRYYAIMTQVTTAHGDMARTLNAPANQLRVLQAQATQAARAFGNVFIPILNAVLPVCIAVAKAIRLVAAAIASLFGFSLPSVDYSGITSGIDDVAAGIGGIGDQAEAAGGAAKKLKTYLMGFDELNIIEPDDNSGGGGGGGGGGGSDSAWDWDLPVYDFLGGLVDSAVEGWMKKLQPAIDWITEHLEEILAVAKAIGAEFLMWKLAKNLLPNLGSALAHMEKIMSILTALATAVITVMLVYEFDNKYLETGKFGYLIADAIATGLGSAIIGGVIAHSFNATAGWYAATAMVAISAIVSIGLALGNIGNEGLTKENILLLLWGAIKAAVAGAMLAHVLPDAIGVSWIEGAIIGFSLAATVGLTLAAWEQLDYEQGFSTKVAQLLAAAALAGTLLFATLAPKFKFTRLEGGILGFFITASIGLFVSAMKQLEYDEGFSDKVAGLLAGASVAAGLAMVAAAHKLKWTKLETAQGFGFAFLGVASIGLLVSALKTLDYEEGFTDNVKKLLTGASVAGGLAMALAAPKLGWSVISAGTFGLSLIASIGLLVSAVKTLEYEDGFTGKVAGLMSGASVAGALAFAMAGAKLGFSKLGSGAFGLAITVAIGLALTAEKTVEKDGLTFDALAQDALSVASAAIGGALLAVGLGGTIATGAVLGLAGGLALTVMATVVALTVEQGNIFKRVAMWGSVKASAEQIKTMVESMFTFDVNATATLVKTTITNYDEAKEALTLSVTEFQNALNPVSIGVTLDDSDGTLTSLKEQLEGETGILANFQAMLTASDDVVKLAVSLAPPTDEEGINLDSTGILTALGLSEEALGDAMDDFGGRLSELLAKGIKDGLTEQEAALVTELTLWVSRIQRAMAQGQVAGEFGAKLSLALTDLDRGSFKDAVDVFKEYKENVITSMTEIETKAYSVMKGQRDALEMTRQAYIEIGEEVPQSVADAITKIDTELEGWDLAASIKTATDNAIEPGKRLFMSAFHSIFDDVLSTIIEQQPFDALVLEVEMGLYNDMTDFDITEYSEGLSGRIEQAMRQALGKDYDIVMDVAGMFDITGWDMLSGEVQTQIFTAFEDAWGSDNAWETFKALGYDMSTYVAKGIADGSLQVKNEAGELVLTLKDGTKVALGKENATMVKLFNALGADLVDGMVLGIDGELSAEAQALADLFGIPYETAAAENEVHSPSQLFKRLGIYIVDGLLLGLATLGTKLSTVWTTLPGWFQTMVNKIIGTFTGMQADVGDLFTSMASGAHTAWSNSDTWFSTNVTTPLTTKFNNLKKSISDAFSGAKTDTTATWSTVSDWFNEKVKTPIVNLFANGSFKTTGTTAATDLKTGLTSVTLPDLKPTVSLIKNGWETVSKWVSGLKGSTSVTQSVGLSKGWAQSTIADWAKAQSPISSITVPVNLKKGSSSSLSWTMTSGGTSSKPSYTLAAKGAILEAGQMFVAREAGPELVGTIGNRSAVANNDQIIQGISGGVREANSAVVDAIYTLIQAVEEKDTSVNIGDEEIGRANDRYKRKRGLNVNSGAFANSY